MKTNPNDPIAWTMFVKSQTSFDVYEGQFQGLNKREYFAAMAMQGMIAGTSGVEALAMVHSSSYCETAVQCADALIEVLNR